MALPVKKVPDPWSRMYFLPWWQTWGGRSFLVFDMNQYNMKCAAQLGPKLVQINIPTATRRLYLEPAAARPALQGGWIKKQNMTFHMQLLNRTTVDVTSIFGHRIVDNHVNCTHFKTRRFLWAGARVWGSTLVVCTGRFEASSFFFIEIEGALSEAGGGNKEYS